jgi:3-methyladenine DNA glycosylase AlkD
VRGAEEFIKRAAFALLASVALQRQEGTDAAFVRSLRLIERASTDERNFVKKGVNWALRSIGGRNLVLHAKVMTLSRKLADSSEPSARWNRQGRLRDLSRPIVQKKLARAAT